MTHKVILKHDQLEHVPSGRVVVVLCVVETVISTSAVVSGGLVGGLCVITVGCVTSCSPSHVCTTSVAKAVALTSMLQATR